MMRYQTNAARIRRGVPIFVTFSPDEKHNMIMLRLSRTRRNDPVNLCDELAPLYGGLMQPDIDVDYVHLGVSLHMLQGKVPNYDDRRAIISRDALASVDGFRVMVHLIFEFIFGIRFCPHCPDCNNGEHSTPCQDLFGSSARAEGGIFGRVDAVFTSIEAQTSTGSLHAHSQVFVQCLHQHQPLWDIATKLSKDFKDNNGTFLMSI